MKNAINKEETWEEITRPLREAAKKGELKESDVEGIIHLSRRSNKNR